MIIKYTAYDHKPAHLTVLRDVMGDLEISESPRALGVNHSLRDPLPVKVGNEVDQVGVLQQDGAPGAGRLAVVVVIDGATKGRGYAASILSQKIKYISMLSKVK